MAVTVVLLQVAENSAVFKRDLKEPSEEADRRSGSREFHTEGMAVEKARDAEYKVTASLENISPKTPVAPKTRPTYKLVSLLSTSQMASTGTDLNCNFMHVPKGRQKSNVGTKRGMKPSSWRFISI